MRILIVGASATLEGDWRSRRASRLVSMRLAVSRLALHRLLPSSIFLPTALDEDAQEIALAWIGSLVVFVLKAAHLGKDRKQPIPGIAIEQMGRRRPYREPVQAARRRSNAGATVRGLPSAAPPTASCARTRRPLWTGS